MKTEKWYANALMLNRDPCWYRGTIDDSSADAYRKSLEDYFSVYEVGLTDVCIGVLEQTVPILSKNFTLLSLRSGARLDM